MKWYLVKLFGHGMRGEGEYLSFLTMQVVGVERPEVAGTTAEEAVHARVRKEYGSTADDLVVEWFELEELEAGPPRAFGLMFSSYQDATELAECRAAAFEPLDEEDDAPDESLPLARVANKAKSILRILGRRLFKR